jgi:hypothetical protein
MKSLRFKKKGVFNINQAANDNAKTTPTKTSKTLPQKTLIWEFEIPGNAFFKPGPRSKLAP